MTTTGLALALAADGPTALDGPPHLRRKGPAFYRGKPVSAEDVPSERIHIRNSTAAISSPIYDNASRPRSNYQRVFRLLLVKWVSVPNKNNGRAISVGQQEQGRDYL
jgi:hypothetical protein